MARQALRSTSVVLGAIAVAWSGAAASCGASDDARGAGPDASSALLDGTLSAETGADGAANRADANGDDATGAGDDANDGGTPTDAGAEAAAVDAAAVAIARNLGANLFGLAASAGKLFWFAQGNGTLSRCEAANCAATLTTLYVDGLTLDGLAVDSTRVYFTETGGQDGGALYSLPIDSDGGVAPTPLATGLAGPLAIEVDATGVYFTQYSDGTPLSGWISRCDPGNCAATLTSIANQPYADGVALDATFVYWCVRAGSVEAAPKSSFGADSGVVIASSMRSPSLLTLDATNAYFVAYDSSPSGVPFVRFCPRGGCGGDAGLLSTTPTQSSNFGPLLASDGEQVYFSSDDGNVIERCPITGCGGAASPYTTLEGDASASSMVAYASDLYVAASGTIYKIAK